MDFDKFPKGVKGIIGYQLFRVQAGGLPSSFDTIKLPSGTVYEVRHKDTSGIYRVLYVANLGSKVHILHSFKKKTQATPDSDKKLANGRLKALKKSLEADNVSKQ